MDSKENIVEGLDAGANDYMTKPFSPGELKAQIDVGRRIIELQTALTTRVRELEAALAHVKTLQGILPICMHCRKIRDDQETWLRIESYLSENADIQCSHGICTDCLDTHYRDLMADNVPPEG